MGKVLRREGLGAGAGLLQKAEAARLECEGDGAPSPSHSCQLHKKNRQLAVFLIYLLLVFHFP
ncbi:hypothetical protein CN374_00440 [Bacillus cereus]|nr:hypothetical protein CN374_00440 [Bacillus cereus]PGU34204.1 hypothetical protein COD66_13135 [Bacillus cereus]